MRKPCSDEDLAGSASSGNVDHPRDAKTDNAQRLAQCEECCAVICLLPKSESHVEQQGDWTSSGGRWMQEGSRVLSGTPSLCRPPFRNHLRSR